jgi:hypothetical protein
MRDRQVCIGCGKKSPETETNYTLISAQFGWRLTRYKDADGTIVIEWRCPNCWRDYKKSKGADAIPPSGFAATESGKPGSEPSTRAAPRAKSEAPPAAPSSGGRAAAPQQPAVPRPAPASSTKSSAPPARRTR